MQAARPEARADRGRHGPHGRGELRPAAAGGLARRLRGCRSCRWRGGRTDTVVPGRRRHLRPDRARALVDFRALVQASRVGRIAADPDGGGPSAGTSERPRRRATRSPCSPRYEAEVGARTAPAANAVRAVARVPGRREADGPPARRTHPRGAVARAARSRFLLEDRHAQRHGHRRGRPVSGRSPRTSATCGWRWARSRRRSCGRRRPRRSRPRPSRTPGRGTTPRRMLPEAVVEEFGELVAAAATPIDDVRGTAAYRRHACAVLARRSLAWALEDRRMIERAVG